MDIITQEMLAETTVKNIIKNLHEDFSQSEYDSFDEYLWDHLAELGRAAYNEIGNMYRDADDAANEVL